MANVPDDWNAFWARCEFCGGRYHASEGGCSCVDAFEDCPCGKCNWVKVGGAAVCDDCGGEPGDEPECTCFLCEDYLAPCDPLFDIEYEGGEITICTSCHDEILGEAGTEGTRP